MKKRGLLIGGISLILLVFIGMISYLIMFTEPQITIEAEIKPITDSDYDRIKERTESYIKTAAKDDFKRIYVEINYSEPLVLISNRKIEFNGIFTPVFVAESGVIILGGGRGEDDNPNKAKATYFESAEVYLNGKRIDEIKNSFDSHKIKISWNKFGTKEERVYYLKDYIKIIN